MAALLIHPGTCDEPQDILLKRLEELAFYDGRQVLLTPETKVGRFIGERGSYVPGRRRDDSTPSMMQLLGFKKIGRILISNQQCRFNGPLRSVAQSDDCAKSVRSDPLHRTTNRHSIDSAMLVHLSRQFRPLASPESHIKLGNVAPSENFLFGRRELQWKG